MSDARFRELTPFVHELVAATASMPRDQAWTVIRAKLDAVTPPLTRSTRRWLNAVVWAAVTDARALRPGER